MRGAMRLKKQRRKKTQRRVGGWFTRESKKNKDSQYCNVSYNTVIVYNRILVHMGVGEKITRFSSPNPKMPSLFKGKYDFNVPPLPVDESVGVDEVKKNLSAIIECLRTIVLMFWCEFKTGVYKKTVDSCVTYYFVPDIMEMESSGVVI